MYFDVPDDCRYRQTHEWARRENGTVRIGISDFAQDALGAIVFVELPEPGDDIVWDAAFGVIESIGTVQTLYAPVSGTVTAVNEDLFDAPELANGDPYGEGWLLAIKIVNGVGLDQLLSPEEYRFGLDYLFSRG